MFSQEFDGALRTRSTAAFRRTFTEGCRVCREDAQLIDQSVAEGKTYETSESELSNLVVTSRPDATRWLVAAHLTSPRLVIRDAAGRVLVDSPAESSLKQFIVVKRAGSWLIEGVTKG